MIFTLECYAEDRVSAAGNLYHPRTFSIHASNSSHISSTLCNLLNMAVPRAFKNAIWRSHNVNVLSTTEHVVPGVDGNGEAEWPLQDEERSHVVKRRRSLESRKYFQRQQLFKVLI